MSIHLSSRTSVAPYRNHRCWPPLRTYKELPPRNGRGQGGAALVAGGANDSKEVEASKDKDGYTPELQRLPRLFVWKSLKCSKTHYFGENRRDPNNMFGSNENWWHNTFKMFWPAISAVWSSSRNMRKWVFHDHHYCHCKLGNNQPWGKKNMWQNSASGVWRMTP